jgi:hypothetical protein
MRTKLIAACLLNAILIVGMKGWTMEFKDAYIRHEDNTWKMGTAGMERTVALEGGRFVLKSFLNKQTGLEMVPKGGAGDEFSFATEKDGERVSGASGGWSLVDSHEAKLKNGELQLDIALRRENHEVTKSYVIHPETSVIREWITVRNAGNKPVRLVDPGFLNIAARLGKSADLDFHWMTGGACIPGSLDLQSEKLSATPRVFDSYDEFPIKHAPLGDGIKARILHNDK